MKDLFPSLTIDNIKSRLLIKQERLAVAESVTAGFLQAAFSTAQDASMFFEGGITAYNIDQKTRHLSIDKSQAANCNCVSGQTAEEMAKGVVRLFKSDWGIGITGYASPNQSSDFLLFAFFSFCHNGKIMHSQRVEVSNRTPIDAQLLYVNEILTAFEKIIT